MEEYSFKKVTKESISDIIPLFELCFNKKISFEELNIKYSTKEFGADFLGIACYFENKVVAFVGAIPTILKQKNKELLGAQIVDLMVHPKHVRYGLFQKTATELFDYLKGKEFKLIFGFPNESAKPGWKKRLKWEFTDDLCVSIMDSKCLPFLLISRKLPFLKNAIYSYQKSLIKSKSVRPKDFVSCLGDSYFQVNKTVSLLSYKQKNDASYVLDINGISVWVKIDSMYLSVGDFEDCNFNQFEDVIRELKKLNFKLGIPHLRFHISDNSKMKGYLDRLVSEDEKRYPVGGILFDPNLNFSEFKFSMADHDTF